MKNIKLIIIACLAIMLSSCNDYIEVVPGYATTTSRSQGFRSEGGGQQDSSYLSGTHKVGTFTQTVEDYAYDYTPKWYKVRFSIPNNKMDKQTVKGEVAILVMLNPTLVHSVNANFQQYEAKIISSLTAATRAVLGNIDMGMGQVDEKSNNNEFENRIAVSKELFNETVKNFRTNNQGFDKEFIFIDAAINNLDFPPEIMAAFVKVAKSEILLDQKPLEDELNKILNTINVEKSSLEVDAFTQELQNLDSRIIDDKSVDMVLKAAEDPSTELTIYLTFDKNGKIRMFSPAGR